MVSLDGKHRLYNPSNKALSCLGTFDQIKMMIQDPSQMKYLGRVESTTMLQAWLHTTLAKKGQC